LLFVSHPRNYFGCPLGPSCCGPHFSLIKTQTIISEDLAGILGDTWRAPKAGRYRGSWGMESGVPFPADQGVSGERRELPKWGALPETNFGVF